MVVQNMSLNLVSIANKILDQQTRLYGIPVAFSNLCSSQKKLSNSFCRLGGKGLSPAAGRAVSFSVGAIPPWLPRSSQH